MPRYSYRGKDASLKVIEGTVEAESESAALSALTGQGLFPIAVNEVGAAAAQGLPWMPQRISARHLAYLTRQLADLISGGLPLLNALTLLAGQTEHRQLRRVVERLASAVRDGRALSEALADHPRVFPQLYVQMVRAGEVGGGLEEVLNRLADLHEHEAELRSRIVMAAVYPVFVLVLALALTTFLLVYVVPTVAAVFVESGQQLPLPTRIVLGISGFLTSWWWAILGGGLLLGWSASRAKARQALRGWMDRWLLRVPGVGRLTRQIDAARFARNLGVMLGQGVPVLQALEVVSHQAANRVLRKAIGRMAASVRDGSTLARAVGDSGELPLFVSQMVAVGEESGTVDRALLKVAVTYEREVDRTIRMLTTVLEPVLLLIVGGVVTLIVLAVLLPIFELGLVSS